MERTEIGEGKGEREKSVGLWTTLTKDIPSLVQEIKAWVPSVTNGLNAIPKPWVIGAAALATVGSIVASAVSFGCIAKAQMRRADAEEQRAEVERKRAEAKAERAEAERKRAEAAEKRARQAAVATRGGGGGGRHLSWP